MSAPDGIDIHVHVRPGGRRDGIDGLHDGVLAVRVSAPPEGGKANAAVRKVVANAFGLRPSAVTITAGHTARRKRLLIEGDPATLSARHHQLLGPST